MKCQVWILVVLAMLLTYGSGQQRRERQFSRPLATNVKVDVASSGGDFRYNAASFAVTELARSIGAIMGQQSNAGVFSPVSIACALSLMLLGADKQTRQELVRVLKFEQHERNLATIHQLYSDMLNDLTSTEEDPRPPVWRSNNTCGGLEDSDYDDDEFRAQPDVLRLTNAVFVREGLTLDQGFRQASKRFYNSSVVNLPFSAYPAKSATVINEWVRRSTEGKIREIVPSVLDTNTEMIVASALYFKGLWTEMFEQTVTVPRPFYPDGYSRPSKSIPTMAAIACFPYYDAVEYDAKIVGLSYQGNKSAMYIIMPNNSTRERMQRFQRELRAEHIGDMVSKMVQRKVFLQLPKMKISNTINLRDILQRLGLRTIFDSRQSDLSGMLAGTQFAARALVDPDERVVFPGQSYDTKEKLGMGQNRQDPLYVSNFIHKVELDINEKGTEGGAVTASTIYRSLPSVHFRVDAPFLLMIGHDRTRLPLFYGSIYDPSS